MITKEIQIENHNGLITGFVTKPSKTPKGCVICLHGGPGGNFHGNTNVFDQIAERIVEIDFATIQFSVYGATPSGGSQEDTSIRTQLIDFSSIVEYSKKNFDCPIHVIAESAGATIASLNWLKQVKSYILLWPAFDLKDTDLGPYLTPKWWSKVDKDGFLNDNGVIIGKELFIELLLTDFSRSFVLPSQDILIIHGQADKEVPFYQSIKALSNSNGNVTFASKKDADHGFKEKSYREFVLDHITRWLKDM